jgi:hypothetical protein
MAGYTGGSVGLGCMYKPWLRPTYRSDLVGLQHMGDFQLWKKKNKKSRFLIEHPFPIFSADSILRIWKDTITSNSYVRQKRKKRDHVWQWWAVSCFGRNGYDLLIMILNTVTFMQIIFSQRTKKCSTRRLVRMLRADSCDHVYSQQR